MSGLASKQFNIAAQSTEHHSDISVAWETIADRNHVAEYRARMPPMTFSELSAVASLAQVVHQMTVAEMLALSHQHCERWQEVEAERNTAMAEVADLKERLRKVTAERDAALAQVGAIATNKNATLKQ
jgi:hypothetical protein